MQFKSDYADCQVVIHYNRETEHNFMSLFYSEASVVVSKGKAHIDFGAFGAKGTHVTNRVKPKVVTMIARPGPMDYVDVNCPALV